MHMAILSKAQFIINDIFVILLMFCLTSFQLFEIDK